MTPMKLKEMISFIEEIETNYHVNEWIIDNIHIWPLIRINLIFSLATPTYLPLLSSDNNRKRIINKIRTGVSIIGSISSYLYAHLMDCKKNAPLTHKYDVIFLSDGISYVYLKDAWYERFCDPLIEEFRNMNRSCLLMSPSTSCFVPRKSPSLMVQPYIDYIKIKEKIFPCPNDHFVENMSDYNSFLKLLQYNCRDSTSYSLENITSQINILRKCANYFKNILEEIRPTMGITVSYYSTHGMAFNLACREYGIPSVDVQHGFQGDSNMAYARWKKLPKRGYELLPSIFLCWSDDDAKNIAEWSYNVPEYHRPIAFGNSSLSIWQSSDNEFVKYYDNVVNSRKLALHNFTHILYTLSCATQSEIDTLINIIHKLEQIELPCFFWLRLHPTRLNRKNVIRNIVNKYKFEHVDFQIASTIPLYALLRNVDIHITEFSSTVIEAEYFRVHSIITHEFGSQTFRKQIDSGMASVAYHLSDIIDAIREQIQNGTIINRGINNEQYSKIDLSALLDNVFP